MKKRLFAFIVVTAALVLSAGCSPKAAVATEAAAAATAAPAATEAPKDAWGELVIPKGGEVKIGVSSALSAGYAAYGQDMLNGVNLAIEKFGGSLKGFKVVAVGGDDQCEGAPGVTVAEQFSADPAILGVVGPMCSGTVVPATDIYNKNHILMITPSGTAVAVTARGFENIFRTIPNDDKQAEVSVDYLSKVLNVKKLAVVHDSSIYGQGIAEAVQKKFTAAGGTVTGFQGVTRGDTDFSAVVSSVVAGSPEAVYWGGMDAEGALLVNQLQKGGFKGVFFGPDGIKSKPVFVDGSGGAAEGAYITFGAASGASGYDAFLADFKAKYPDVNKGEPVAYGPGSYDDAMFMLKAADAVGKVDANGNLVVGRKALVDYLRANTWLGVTGKFMFDKAGDPTVVTLTVFKVVGGEIVPQKEYKFGE
jgi:branched-chain amino acid transport system substrate-binding protein